MKFYFYPNNDSEFKTKAVGNFVHTIVFDTQKQKIAESFTRQVNKIWTQTCKNNIESDHRIKTLKGNEFQVYRWISESKDDLSLPSFTRTN